MSRPPLSRESIFETALHLVDAHGIGALTMRRLAAEMGVGTMSLYSHVPNKDDLLDGVVGTVAGEIGVAPVGSDWRQAVRHMLSEFRRVARRHPNVVPLMVTRPPASTQGMNLVEAGFDHLRRAGVDEKTMARAYRLVVSYAIGFVSLETGGFFSSAGPAAMDRARESERFPTVAGVAPYLIEWDAEEEFRAGIDIILDYISGHTADG
ncbi:MAG: TetR/AcrR family transcriptional regulator C-terminal domain-containing protein [Actinomycetota bacterium]|nr:TetR/AcrR family transcriptional regulator C-terminal domain-containing protein [Actinomycetota bacterium]